MEPPVITGMNWLAIGLMFVIGAAYQLAHPTIADVVDPKSFPWDKLVASDTEAAALLPTYRQIADINDIRVPVPRERVAEVLAKSAFVR